MNRSDSSRSITSTPDFGRSKMLKPAGAPYWFFLQKEDGRTGSDCGTFFSHGPKSAVEQAGDYGNACTAFRQDNPGPTCSMREKTENAKIHSDKRQQHSWIVFTE
jgi:hypothetical protein